MALISLAFYLFAMTIIAAAIMVVLARNPVHSVLWLICVFFSGSGLFVLLGAEFLAMFTLIVYVGAVAVLFLFVVMMLDVNFSALKRDIGRQLPFALLISGIMLAEFILAAGAYFAPKEEVEILAVPSTHNILAIGHLLYDDYLLPFQISGVILLVAMIGAIVLTMRQRQNVKRQDTISQIYRTRKDAVELKDVKPGKGIQ